MAYLGELIGRSFLDFISTYGDSFHCQFTPILTIRTSFRFMVLSRDVKATVLAERVRGSLSNLCFSYVGICPIEVLDGHC